MRKRRLFKPVTLYQEVKKMELTRALWGLIVRLQARLLVLEGIIQELREDYNGTLSSTHGDTGDVESMSREHKVSTSQD